MTPTDDGVCVFPGKKTVVIPDPETPDPLSTEEITLEVDPPAEVPEDPPDQVEAGEITNESLDEETTIKEASEEDEEEATEANEASEEMEEPPKEPDDSPKKVRFICKVIHDHEALSFGSLQSDAWKPVVSALTSSRKLRWLRQRLTGCTAETALMNRIAEFVLYDHPIDIENLRKSLHHQVERASIRLKGIQNILTLVHKEHLVPSVKYALLSGWLGYLRRTVTRW